MVVLLEAGHFGGDLHRNRLVSIPAFVLGVVINSHASVSVIIASRNSSRFLEASITSALHQTLTDIEVIVIDDCSTDGSLQLASQYAATDDRLRVLTTPTHSGPGPTRNVGIEATRAKWIAILDADDVAAPDRLVRQLQVAEAAPTLILIGSDSFTIDADGSSVARHRYPKGHRRLQRSLHRHRAFPPHSSMLYRTDPVREIGGFEPRFHLAHDHDLWLRLAEIGTFASVGEPLVGIRKHDKNASRTGDGKPGATFAVAASVCHWLRASGNRDPSRNATQPEWDTFLAWVEQRADEEGVFELLAALLEIRDRELRNRSRPVSAVVTGLAVLRNRRAIPLISQHWLGYSLPKDLAKQWASAS